MGRSRAIGAHKYSESYEFLANWWIDDVDNQLSLIVANYFFARLFFLIIITFFYKLQPYLHDVWFFCNLCKMKLNWVVFCTISSSHFSKSFMDDLVREGEWERKGNFKSGSDLMFVIYVNLWKMFYDIFLGPWQRIYDENVE